MATLKRGALVASTLTLVAIIAAACNQPYSQPPSATNTPINPDSLFATPIGGPTDMTDVQNFATGTSQALTGTPAAGLAADLATSTPQVGTPSTETITSTSPVVVNPTTTATSTLAVPSGTLPTSIPVGTRPSSYTLQRGEFPYCIARRFDVNPEELLRVNGLTRGDIYYPNLTLTIPQTGSFPPPRALRTHPTTYSATAGQTVYGVACVFGDVYPSAIAQANNISESAVLTAGQSLSIP
jgi:LysM repeat protein